MYTNDNNGRDKSVGHPLDRFMGGRNKTVDLAHFYNLALDAVDKIKITHPLSNVGFWSEYFWRSHLDRKNNKAYVPTDIEAKLVQETYAKLKQIRNFQSHIWHDDCVLAFSTELASWIKNKYERAKAYLFENNQQAMLDFEALDNQHPRPLFKQVHSTFYITVEGRIFFLSFFLSREQMNSLLQQRKGHKRTDMPLYKMKRELYTFYCHRDGAAIARMNQANDEWNFLRPEQQKDIKLARQAFRLLSYLQDYPSCWKTLLPEHPSELLVYCKERGILSEFHIQLERDGFHLEHERFTGQTWLMKTSHFRELLTLIMLFEFTGRTRHPKDLLLLRMEKLLEHRTKMITLMQKSVFKLTEDEIDFLQIPEHQLLRTQRLTTQNLIAYFEQFDPQKESTGKLGRKLAGFLEIEPIQLYPQDFNETETRKFRNDNQFMLFAAQYLMDFGPEEWYWCMERFENGVPGEGEKVTLNKIKEFHQPAVAKALADFRICIEEDHVILGIPKSPDGVLVEGVPNYKSFYQIAIGPKAMRYLMARMLVDSKAITPLKALPVRLKNDLDLLRKKGGWADGKGFKLLEPVFLPPYLKNPTGDISKLFNSALNRLTHMRQVWQEVVEHPDRFTRHEKNRLVMLLYRQFDWVPEKGNTVKFLRRHEYQQLSVCHYSLHLKKKKVGYSRNKGGGSSPNKFEKLFRDVFQLDTRKPPIPREIKSLLQQANDLDDLVGIVGQHQIPRLEAELNNIASLPNLQRKKALSQFCRKIGLSIPVNCLVTSEQQMLRKKHSETLEFQVIPLHPMLVVKALFTDEYQQSTDENRQQQIGGRKALSIFKNIREDQLRCGLLRNDYYRHEIAQELFCETDAVKVRENAVGLLDKTKTEDVIIAWMAEQYLSKNPFTEVLSNRIKDVINQNRSYAPELYHEPITLEICDNKGKGIGLYMQVRLHQLDDLIYNSHRYMFPKAAHLYRRRLFEENTIWESELQRLREDRLKGAPLPDGSLESPIPIELLIDEIRLVRRTALKLGNALFDFERSVIEKLGTAHLDKDAFQTWLINRNPLEKAEDVHHFKFDNILVHAVELGLIDSDLFNRLKKVRDKVLHGNIPEESFSWMTREGEQLRSVLNILEDLHAGKDEAKY
jgi:hypothetical protein